MLEKDSRDEIPTWYVGAPTTRITSAGHTGAHRHISRRLGDAPHIRFPYSAYHGQQGRQAESDDRAWRSGQGNLVVFTYTEYTPHTLH
jgi:hypothetical protein